MSVREFEAFRSLVAARTGIELGPHKCALLQARLGARLRALGLATFAEYHRVLEQEADREELGHFINAVTTNKTEFFREIGHFTYLREQWVPQALARAATAHPRSVRIWSAGCSTGAEPYTIAITLADALEDVAGWDLRILASDINTDVLRRASAGIYSREDVCQIPRTTLRRHFLRGVGANAGMVRLRSALRRLVTFRRINLIEEGWPIRIRFDVIFCRNVLIYFDRPTQQYVLRRLLGSLNSGGILILGQSEGVHGAIGSLRRIGGTIYRKEADNAGDHPSR